MLRTQIYLPEKQIRLLKAMAARQDISLSEAIRQLIGEKLKGAGRQKRAKNTGSWILGLAKEAKRLNFKGPKDLATSLDRYLYGGK